MSRVPLSGSPAPSRHLLTGIRKGSGDHSLIALALELLDGPDLADQPAADR